MKPPILFFLLLSFPLYAQTQIFGKLTDAATNEALPFVNIGIPEKGVGTVSDQNGLHTLEIPPEFKDQILRFSMIGFSAKEVKISSLDSAHSTLLDVSLIEEPIALKEVVVTDGEWQNIAVGNTTESKLIVAGFTSNKLGNEIAQFIKVKKRRPTLLKSFWLSIAENTIESVILRLNIYDEHQGYPAENLLDEPIYIKLPNDPQTIRIDLSSYDIYLESNFFISIEWIEDLEVEGLWFSAGVLGKSLYARSASQAMWVRKKALSIGMGVEMLQKN